MNAAHFKFFLETDSEWDFLVLLVKIDVKSMSVNEISPEKCWFDLNKSQARIRKSKGILYIKWIK